MKVSIITVCYNSAKTIERTIKSVLAQTYSDIEYIIVDGASSDNTLSIVENYRNEFGDRLVVISEKDDGLYFAMNKGIKLSRGELIGIINSDDYYEPDAVSKMVDKYSSLDKKMVVLHGKTYAYKEGELKFVACLVPEKLEERMSSHPSCFVAKEVYNRFGAFNTKYSCVADHDLMLRLYRSKQVDFVFLNDHIANAELGGISASNKAYIDMLHFQYDYKKIGYLKMNIEIFKSKLACEMINRGFKPLKLRRKK